MPIGEGDGHQLRIPHILEDKIHGDRDPFVLPDHFVAQGEAAGLKKDVRLKASLPAAAGDQVVDLKLAALYVQPFSLQIPDGDGLSAAA